MQQHRTCGHRLAVVCVSECAVAVSASVADRLGRVGDLAAIHPVAEQFDRYDAGRARSQKANKSRRMLLQRASGWLAARQLLCCAVIVVVRVSIQSLCGDHCAGPTRGTETDSAARPANTAASVAVTVAAK